MCIIFEFCKEVYVKNIGMILIVLFMLVYVVFNIFVVVFIYRLNKLVWLIK